MGKIFMFLGSKQHKVNDPWNSWEGGKLWKTVKKLFLFFQNHLEQRENNGMVWHLHRAKELLPFCGEQHFYSVELIAR